MTVLGLALGVLLATTQTLDARELYGAPAALVSPHPAADVVAPDAQRPVSPPDRQAGWQLPPWFGIVLVLLLAVGGGWVLWRRRSLREGSHPLIRRIAHAGIAPGQGLALVEVGDDLLVVSTGSGGVRLIHRMPQLMTSDPVPDDEDGKGPMPTEEQLLRSRVAELLRPPRA